MFNNQNEMVDIFVSDPRLSGFGFNFLTFRGNQIERQLRESPSLPDLNFRGDKEYHIYRMLRYVFEVWLPGIGRSTSSSTKQ